MATFKTYDPLTHKRAKYAIPASLIVISLILLPFMYFIPGIKNKVIVFSSILLFGILLFLLAKFNNWKYNGGAEVNINKESVEIKFPNSKRKVFSINSIKKIMLYDNSSKNILEGAEAAPLQFTFIIWTSSPLGKIRLRFTNKKPMREILRYKKPKNTKTNLLLSMIYDNLEIYYF